MFYNNRQNPYSQGDGQRYGQHYGQGQGYGQGQAPKPHDSQYVPPQYLPPQNLTPLQEYQQQVLQASEGGRSDWSEYAPHMAKRIIVIICLLAALFIALYLATAILSTVGVQVEGFGDYASKLHRTLSHRPGSSSWWGGMVQLGLLLWIVYMVIGYVKRKGGR